MFCRQCGKELPNDSKFCDGCGAPTAIPINGNSSNSPQPNTVPPNMVSQNVVPPVYPQQGVAYPPRKQSAGSKAGLIIGLFIISAIVLYVIVIPFISRILGSDSGRDSEEDYPKISAEYMEKWGENRFSADKDHAIEVLAEYTLPSWITPMTYHYMIVRNNYTDTINVESNSTAYDNQGKVVAAGSCRFDALGSKCVSVISELLQTTEDIDHYETTFSCSSSGFYKSAIPYLSYEVNETKDGVVIQVTNVGERDASSVTGVVLYFKDKQLVYDDKVYFSNDSTSFKANSTISVQSTSLFDFDSIEFYLEGTIP